MIQICISKLAYLRQMNIKLQQQSQHLQQQQQQSQSQSQSSTPQIGTQLSAIRATLDELISSQSLLISIVSLCMNALLNYIPNFAESSYPTHLDEFRPILALQLSQPSSFDTRAPLSFGSILWFIEYSLKLLHRVTLRYIQLTSKSSEFYSFFLLA